MNLKEDKTLFCITVVILTLILIMPGSMIKLASGVIANDTITISVNVSQKTMVDINPSNISWNGTGIFPGDIVDSTKEANGYGNIWIENIGSTNISRIWFNASYPSQRPFGMGDPALYDPANFVVLANTSTGSLYFPNRVEYRENDNMYIDLGGVVASDADNMFGRFRNNSYEYFFLVEGTNGDNCTGGTFRYSTDPHTKDATGDLDLSDNTPYVLQQATAGGFPDWSITNVTFGTELYCFSVNYDCTKAIFHRWNADAPGAAWGLCSDVPSYYLNSSLVPGNMSKAWIKASIPYGVPFWGTLGTATDRQLIVFAESL